MDSSKCRDLRLLCFDSNPALGRGLVYRETRSRISQRRDPPDLDAHPLPFGG